MLRYAEYSAAGTLLLPASILMRHRSRFAEWTLLDIPAVRDPTCMTSNESRYCAAPKEPSSERAPWEERSVTSHRNRMCTKRAHRRRQRWALPTEDPRVMPPALRLDLLLLREIRRFGSARGFVRTEGTLTRWILTRD